MDYFLTSGEPTSLRYYYCYYDPSNDKLINGLEYSDEEWEKLDQETQRRWNFFYRPLPDYVGEPQKKMIKKCQDNILDLSKLLNKTYNLLLCMIGLVILIVSISYFKYLSVYFPLFVSFLYFFFSIKKYQLIYFYEKAIGKQELLIIRLGEEINILKSQIPYQPSEEEMAEKFKQELGELEIESLNEILDEPIDQKTIKNHIHHESFYPEKEVHSIYIKSWAVLQPIKIYGSIGFDYTGLSVLYKELRAKILTWYDVKDSNSFIYPYFYRAIYLQYIFLLKDDISTYSFFYDFVTQKKYGKRSETFIYKHISNFSINRSEMNKEHMLSPTGIENFYADELPTFTLSVTSGMHFKCNFLDDSIIENIYNWGERHTSYMTHSIKLDESKKSIEKNLKISFKALRYIRSNIFNTETQGNSS